MLSNCCLIRLNVQLPAHSVRLEVCSVTTPTPDGACELRAEEMRWKTAPRGDKHNSFYLLLKKKKSSEVLFCPRETSLTRSLKHGSLENLHMTQNDRMYLIFFFFFTAGQTLLMIKSWSHCAATVWFDLDITARSAGSCHHISPSATKLFTSLRLSPKRAGHRARIAFTAHHSNATVNTPLLFHPAIWTTWFLVASE